MTPGEIYAALLGLKDGEEVSARALDEVRALLNAIRRGEVRVVLTATRVSLLPPEAPGPVAEFAARLRRLYAEADPPRTQRHVAEALECSKTTVIRLMHGQALSSWALVRLFVEMLGGDPGEYREGYLAAKAARKQARWPA